MDTLPAWILVLLVLAAAYPWSCWLIAHEEEGSLFWLPILLSLGLATGTLSLLMFWQALVGIHFDLWSVTLPYGLLMLPGLGLWWRAGAKRPALHLPRTWPERLVLALLVMISAGVLFNSIYWPFSREDTIGIYARYGEAMYTSRALAELPGSTTVYEAYPLLIPLNYTYAYLASGEVNEFLARLFPGLMSLGTLAAVYTLGVLLHSRAAGWIGALLLAITPTFVSWASSGYVDLPMAFFYTLSAIFAWRLWQHNRAADALLAGLLMGLAAWTKNAALPGIGLLGLWLLWAFWQRRTSWRQIILTMAACAAVAAPWYIRNWLGAGLIIPPSVWTERASQTLGTLLVLITHPETYSVVGPLVLLGVLSALIDLIRRRLNASGLFLLLLWTLPFHIFWWLFASYDPRFILLYLPLWCVLTGVQIARFWPTLPVTWQRRLWIPLLAGAVVLALWATWNSVEYKDDILRNPLMSAETRKMTVIRERQPHLYERWYGSDAP